MWSIGRIKLGLSDSEFWGTTLRLFSLLADRYNEVQRREDHRIGTLTAVVANLVRDSRQRPDPYTWKDFFGAETEEDEELSEEECAAQLEAWALTVNAKLKRDAESKA